MQRSPVSSAGAATLAESETLYSGVTSLLGDLRRDQEKAFSLERIRWVIEAGALITNLDEQTSAEVARNTRRYEALHEKIQHSVADTQEEFVELDAKYRREIASLEEQGDFAAFEALRIIDDAFRDANRRYESLEYLSSGDLIRLRSYLTSGKHREYGKVRGQRTEKRLMEELERRSAGSDDVSTLQKIWTVVGWDSWSDFAADAALTIVSGGTAKLIKTAYKGAKAGEKIKAMRRMKRLLNAGKTAKRGRAVKDIILAIPTVAGPALADAGQWLTAKWPTLVKKLSTDVAAGELTSTSKPGRSTVVKRVTRQAIDEAVAAAIPTAHREKRLGKAVFVAMMLGQKRKALRHLRSYLNLSYKRRMAAELLYRSVHKGTGFDLPPSTEFFSASGSVILQMAQDLTTQVPLLSGGVKAWLVEILRKSASKALGEALK